jgi:UDP-N-acetylglucosamine:LPS N-acetylglucosamine transferase
MKTPGPTEATPIKIGLVCSHGGHLTEMLELGPAFEGYDIFYYSYEGETSKGLPNVYTVPNRPYSPIQFVLNLFRTNRILKNEKPDFVVSTGAEIAIPIFLMAKMRGIPTAYVECGNQVTIPSITGRVICRLTKNFFVQWPELLPSYRGRAQYRGSLIDDSQTEEAGL